MLLLDSLLSLRPWNYFLSVIPVALNFGFLFAPRIFYDFTREYINLDLTCLYHRTPQFSMSLY